MDEICWMDATEMAARVADRSLSPVEIADAHLARIADHNPGLGAIVYHDPDAVRDAAATLADRVAAGEDLGPLGGVPYSIKDLDDVAGVPTSYGIPFLRDSVAATSSVVAERMAAAGGLFLGKTNSPELGYQGTCRNHAFPPTHNPWRRDYTPGGSSGGAAAAVVAGLGPLADGSDGAGSIRIPAALCGAVGFKPSFGRVPAELGFSQTLVHHGPLARTVGDAALMFSVIEGAHARDPRSIGASGVDPAAVAAPGAVARHFGDRPLRVAVATGLPGFDVQSDIASRVEQAADVLAGHLGAQLTASAPNWGDLIEPMWVLWQDFYGRFAPLLPAEFVRGQVDDDLLDVLAGGAALTATDLHQAEAQRQAAWHELVRWFEDFDVWVLPTLGITAFPFAADHPPELEGRPLRDRILRWLLTFPFNLCAPCPVLSAPAGLGDDGLPIGVSIAGRAWDDAGVLAVAAELERARPWPVVRPPLAG